MSKHKLKYKLKTWNDRSSCMRQRILPSGAPDTAPVSSKIAFRVCSIYSWMSQKFVPLILCSITFDRNFILTWNFYKMLMLYQVLVFRSSVPCTPPSIWFLSLSVGVAASDGTRPAACKHGVETKMIQFELFCHLVCGRHYDSQTISSNNT